MKKDQLAHKQDVKKQLLYTDLDSLKTSQTLVWGLGFWGFYVGGGVLGEFFQVFAGFFSAQHCPQASTEDKKF